MLLNGSLGPCILCPIKHFNFEVEATDQINIVFRWTSHLIPVSMAIRSKIGISLSQTFSKFIACDVKENMNSWRTTYFIKLRPEQNIPFERIHNANFTDVCSYRFKLIQVMACRRIHFSELWMWAGIVPYLQSMTRLVFFCIPPGAKHERLQTEVVDI